MMVIGVIGIAFLGSGVTGMVTLDESVAPLCQVDAECGQEMVCCPFVDSPAGVCHTPDACTKVLEITKKKREANAQVESVQPLSIQRSAKQENALLKIIFGVFLVAITTYSIYHHFLVLRKKLAHRSKRRHSH